VARRPLAAATSAAGAVTAGSGMSAPKAAKRFPKGRLFPAAAVLGQRFRSALTTAALAGKIDLQSIGIGSLAELRRVLIEAHRRLGKSRVTATDWLGRVLEVVAPKLPALLAREAEVIALLQSLANRHIGSRKGGPVFADCRGGSVKVGKPFTKRRRIYNTKIRLPGQPVGHDYVDAGTLIANADGQELFVSMEFKSRGAAGELPGQIADRNKRLADAAAIPGAKLAYNVEGQPGQFETDLADVVSLTSARNPALAGTEPLLSKIGVVAGGEFAVSIAKDAAGEHYIRIVVPVVTDTIRKLLERLLRDRSWQ
jgi:hypothetical protein